MRDGGSIMIVGIKKLQQFFSTCAAVEARLTKRSGQTGVWQTATPNTFNGSVLSKEDVGTPYG